MIQIGIIILGLGIPLLLLHYAPKVKLIQWLSPAFWCYALGILIGLVIHVPHETIDPIQSGTVALAIPLMLFSANLRAWLRLARPTLISLCLWIGCVCTMSLIAYRLWGQWLLQPEAATAMASSVYTGGTANMAAVNRAIGAPVQLFNEMNPTDLFISGTYLLLILTFIPTLIRRLLPPFAKPSEMLDTQEDTPHTPLTVISILQSFGWGLLAVIIPAGLSFLIFGNLNESFLLIGLTCIGLGGALIPIVQRQIGTYELGEYFFLVFCLVMGTQIDIQALIGRAPVLLGFMATISLGSVALHILLAKWFKIDADTALITQVSGMYGPPFIGPVATRLENRDMVVSGLTLSVILLAVGNFIGLGIHALLT